jgi:outer membrane protein OmpA-like peptidoglycan-associated protein
MFLLVALISFYGLSFAQAPLQNASTDDLLEKLTPQPAQKTRSLSRNLVPEAQVKAEKPSVDLVIQFEFGSAKLLDTSKPLLDNLATVMKGDVLTKYTFNIEGHTDSVGSAIYNKQLSNQRAITVINYLVSKGVSRNRLVGIGKGSAEPLVADKPDSPENRRVRIIVNT